MNMTSVKTTLEPDSMDADTLVNSMPFNQLIEYLDSKTHVCRLHNKTKVDSDGNPVPGSAMIIYYLHEGAKNHHDTWGHQMRYRGYTLMSSGQWVCHKHGFRIGVEVGPNSEDYNPDSFKYLHSDHQLVIDAVMTDKMLPGVNTSKPPVLSFKVDGMFIQLIIMTGEMEQLWRQNIEESDDYFAKALAAYTIDRGFLLMFATNGTVSLNSESMWFNLVTGICGHEGLQISSDNDPFVLFKEMIIESSGSFVEKFCTLFETLNHENEFKSMVPFSANFELTLKDRKNPWESHIHTELASLENSNFKLTGVNFDGEFEPHYVITKHLYSLGFQEPGYKHVQSGAEISDLKEACDQIIRTPNQECENAIVSMMKRFEFTGDSVFHPEGWVLWVWLDDHWVYCKVKLDAFYPAHQPLSRSLNDLLKYPKSGEQFYPKIGEAYEFQKSIKNTIPHLIISLSEMSEKIITSFYNIGKGFIGEMMDGKSATSEFLEFCRNHESENLLFKMDPKAIKSMLTSSNQNMINDKKRILNNPTISNLKSSNCHELFYQLAQVITKEDEMYYNIINGTDDEKRKDLFQLFKYLIFMTLDEVLENTNGVMDLLFKFHES